MPRLAADTPVRPGNMISVAAFGAVGDGVADDYDAIWAAVEAAAFYSTAKQPATIYFPYGTYAIDTPIAYEGRGEALSLVGAGGGSVAWGGSRIKWMGSALADGTAMIDIAGTWRGVVEQIDFDGNDLVETVFWIRSDYPSNDGPGFQGYEFSHCGFMNVRAAATDPVVFRVGTSGGVTQQVDLTTWTKCQFVGNTTSPQLVKLWKQEEGGNTCHFKFESGQMGYGKVGIDASKGSGPLRVDGVYFTGITDASDGTTASCVRLGEACNATITGVMVQNGGSYARFVDTGSIGISPYNGLTMIGCQANLENVGGANPGLGSTVSNSVVVYPGPLFMVNNKFLGNGANDATYAPRITCGAPRLDQAASSNAAGVVEFLNTYGAQSVGSKAPLFDTQGNPLTGTSGPTYLGYYRNSVMSWGSSAFKSGDASQVVPLEPYEGTIPQSGPLQNSAWDPAATPILSGSYSSVLVSWNVASQLGTGDTVTASFDQPLPAGCGLLVPQVVDDSGTKKIRVTIVNNSGSTVTSGAASSTTIPSGTLHLTYVRKVYT